MVQVKLSNGIILDAEQLVKATLWDYPRRLEIGISGDESPLIVYGEDALRDADLLERIHNDHHLRFPVYRM